MGAASDKLERDAEALQRALSELVRVYQFRDRDRICCYDVSVTQCYALETLVEDGTMTLNALAAALYLDKSTASRVVTTLERKGYVARVPHPDDGRAQLLSATATGTRLCRRIQADLLAESRTLIRDLTPEVREGAVLVLRGLARAAETRARVGGPAATSCAPGASMKT